MKIGVIGLVTGFLNAQIARELSDRGHEAIFISEIPDSSCERLGGLENVLIEQNKVAAKSIYEIKDLDMDKEFYNPSFQINNRQARRKSEREAKKHKKQKRKS